MKFLDKLSDFIFSERFENGFAYILLGYVLVLIVLQITLKIF